MTPSTKQLLLVVFSILALVLVVSAQTAREEKAGAALYKKDCTMCHGPDGAGATAMGKKMGLKDLRSPEVQNQTDAQLEEIIAKGKGKMPAYGQKLKPEQIKDLVVHIRDLAKTKK